MVKYEVYYLGHLVKTFLTKEEAEDYIMSCLSDDRIIFADEFVIKEVKINNGI